jgi:hypothetical protein
VQWAQVLRPERVLRFAPPLRPVQALQLPQVRRCTQPQRWASAQQAARIQGGKEQRRRQLSWVHLHSGLSLSHAVERDNSFSPRGQWLLEQESRRRRHGSQHGEHDSQVPINAAVREQRNRRDDQTDLKQRLGQIETVLACFGLLHPLL